MFASHRELFSIWLDRRRDVVASIDMRLLNVRDKPLSRSRDRRVFEQQFFGCFFGLPGLSPDLARLKGYLAERTTADGLQPMVLDGFVHQLDPLELVVRAYEHWGATRWPGGSGRLAFAQTLFAAFMVRQLEALTLRLWDDDEERAGERLAAIQVLLDRLNANATGTVFVRAAHWLVLTAQGPFTLDLAPYFRIARRVAATLSAGDRVAIHSAGARLVGGHLRSQRRYGTWRTGLASHNPEIVAFTRNSNAMDHALLLRDLVGLLRAYRSACDGSSLDQRRMLADAILQGVAVDPELFLVRLDLLTPYVAIEPLCVQIDGAGGAGLTPFGHENVALCDEYRACLAAAAGALLEDAAALNPAGKPYSPFGIVYGFASDVLSNIAMDALVGNLPHGLTLEEAFEPRAHLDSSRARADAWRRLPVRQGEREHFEYSEEFAQEVFDLLIECLRVRASAPDLKNASDTPDVRLVVVQDGRDQVSSTIAEARPRDAESAQQFLLTSDQKAAAATGSTFHERAQLLKERHEGGYLASAEVDGHWWAITKTVLTFATLPPHDEVRLEHVPHALLAPLRLACPEIVEVAE